MASWQAVMPFLVASPNTMSPHDQQHMQQQKFFDAFQAAVDLHTGVSPSVPRMTYHHFTVHLLACCRDSWCGSTSSDQSAVSCCQSHQHSALSRGLVERGILAPALISVCQTDVRHCSWLRTRAGESAQLQTARPPSSNSERSARRATSRRRSATRAGGAWPRPVHVCGDNLCGQMSLLHMQIHWRALKCSQRSAADSASMRIMTDRE